MRNEGLTRLAALVIAGLVLAGCSSSGKDTPATPPADPDQAPVSTAPAPSEPEQATGDFDSAGNVLDPRTGRLLDRTFYFEYDRANLSPSDLAVLEIHAQILQRNSDRTVVVEGHCDERGTREYNLALGERRADAVRRFLLTSGVPSRQIETVSYGEERPEDAGHDESAWSRNRRAVLIYR